MLLPSFCLENFTVTFFGSFWVDSNFQLFLSLQYFVCCSLQILNNDSLWKTTWFQPLTPRILAVSPILPFQCHSLFLQFCGDILEIISSGCILQSCYSAWLSLCWCLTKCYWTYVGLPNSVQNLWVFLKAASDNDVFI